MMKAVAKGIAGLAITAGGVLATLQVVDRRNVDRIWRSLEVDEGAEVFSEAMVVDLPAPVQRYFLHAIQPGTPLAACVRLTMSGDIKTHKDGPRMPLSATEILTPDQGFVWKARVSRGPLILTIADHYAAGRGRTRIALFGLVPIVNATGPDISKAALGRLIAEVVWLPSSLLPQRSVTWEAVDDEHANAALTVDGETTTLSFTIDVEGRLRQVSLPRWQADDRTYVPYGVLIDEERTFGGYTIPSKIRIGWWFGTERYDESIRLTIEAAQFQ
jgi:hypothetical protein